jgi:hypothetical protein
VRLWRSIRKLDRAAEQGPPCQAVSATVRRIRRDRAQGQLWAFAYLAFGRLLQLVVREVRSEREKVKGTRMSIALSIMF